MLNKRIIILFSLFAVIGASCFIFQKKYGLLINATGSLGNWAFVIHKGEYPTQAGQYIAFDPPKNPYYTDTFVKIVGGVGGDVVSTDEDRMFSVNGKVIGRAKEKSSRGDIAHIGPTGIIPQDEYFVYTNNKDSYDSRYQAIGWISKDRVVGIAVPVL